MLVRMIKHNSYTSYFTETQGGVAGAAIPGRCSIVGDFLLSPR